MTCPNHADSAVWLRAGDMVPESRGEVAIMALPSPRTHEMPYQSGFEAPD